MIGTVLDRKYRIVQLVGTGGMAQVYKAVNMSNRRFVAIKMLKEEYKEDAEFLRRFSREANAILNLSHENIVRAHGVGTYNGLPYLVMEYVEGRTLKSLIEENGALPVRTAIGITCQILDALSAAHAHGIIHRDVKPQNVIVTDKGRVKLADFGIAREAKASTVTFSGQKILGSVHYISPEQAKGSIAHEESDLYSVGVCLYEMLTGSVPFEADSTVTVALMHLQDQPVPPIEKNPSIPKSLNDIVLKALAKTPEERYRTARDMRTDLVRSLTDPNGSFVNDPNSKSKNGGKQRPSMYLLISLCVFLPIILISVIILIYVTSCRTDSPKIPSSGDDDPVPVVTATAAPDETPAPTEPAKNTVMLPSVMGQHIDEALSTLYNAGFQNLIVEFEYTSNIDVIGNCVTAQSPVSYSFTDPKKPVRITVYRASPGTYKADVSFTVTLPQEDSKVEIGYETTNVDNIPYRAILYTVNRAPESTEVNISATVYGYDAVTRTLTLYINDEVSATQSVTFSK